MVEAKADQKHSRSRLEAAQKQNCFSVGAGLPAMRAPRYISEAQSMPSQRFGDPTSQLPHLTEFSLQDQVGCQAASVLLLLLI
ncbi:hypothetical protein DA482_07135 [Pseudomonas fluorescens]|nr:hypothetical protein FIP59_08455 [Pseudomonas fluorescens]